MRKRKPVRLGYWLGALVLLLLLSALVEGPLPGDGGGASANAPTAVLYAQLLPFSLPAPMEGTGLAPLLPEPTRAAPLFLLILGPLALAPGLFSRDQNGRVLQEKRSVKSRFSVFPPETASG